MIFSRTIHRLRAWVFKPPWLHLHERADERLRQRYARQGYFGPDGDGR